MTLAAHSCLGGPLTVTEVEVLRHQSVGCAAWLRAASLGAVSELQAKIAAERRRDSRAGVADRSESRMEAVEFWDGSRPSRGTVSRQFARRSRCASPTSRNALCRSRGMLIPPYPSGGLTTSMVAVTTDIVREGKAVVGYGLASVARFAQGGLMRERFMPRLLNAPDGALIDEEGMNLDPFRAWETMMTGEKPGGHGE